MLNIVEPDKTHTNKINYSVGNIRQNQFGITHKYLQNLLKTKRWIKNK